MQKGQSNLFIGGLYALTTAALLATQAPLSFLAAKQLSVAVFIGATELILLLCVPFMLRTRRSRKQFLALLSSGSNLFKFGVLLLIGLIGIVLYVLGLGRGHPIVIAAVLNLDPFWAAVIAYLVAGKKILTSLLTFTLCLIVSFVGAMLLAVSQTDAQSIGLQMFDSGSFLALGLALPVPILWALSGTFVGKWFSDFDDYACIAVTFTMAAVVVIPVTLAVAYSQSGLQLTTDALPALALLAIGTILATGLGRVLYQRALTITDNNNGFVSVFFLLIPAFTCLLSLGMSPWIKELEFPVGPLFFLGLGLVAAPILVFLWQSQRKPDPSSSQAQEFDHAVRSQTPSDQRHLTKAGTLRPRTAFVRRTFSERFFRSSVMTSQSAAWPNGGEEVNPKIDPAPNSNTEKELDDWVSGGDPMTGAQASYLKTLSEEWDAPESFETNLTKAEASKRIDALRSKRESVQTDKSR